MSPLEWMSMTRPNLKSMVIQNIRMSLRAWSLKDLYRRVVHLTDILSGRVIKRDQGLWVLFSVSAPVPKREANHIVVIYAV